MKKETSPFQLIITGIFIFLILIGFLLFSNYKSSTKTSEFIGTVKIWGTLSQSVMDRILDEISKTNKNINNVTYSEISKSSYELDILEAIASGNAPDLIIVSNKNLYKNLNKIYKIPEKNYSARNFTDTFVDVFEIFRDGEGIIAIPFSIDPMVMYYNKDIFATNAISVPPKSWEDFYDLSKKVTILDEKSNIKQSAISFGEVANVNNSKGILSTLFLQLGNPIIQSTDKGYKTNRDFSGGKSPTPALSFFRDFSNPVNPVYSWNRSLPSSKEFFLSGNLATYFGFTSEMRDIRLRNPNLNFDVAEIPGVNGVKRKTVFANILGLSLTKVSKNKSGALRMAYLLSSAETQSIFPKEILLPPVRRDLLSSSSGNLYMDIFYREAVFAKSFIDPDSKKTDEIFNYMVETINGGKYTPESAIENSLDKIDILF